MIRILSLLCFFKVLIAQQTPQLCAKAAEYSNCALNATLQVAACNQNVDSNPDSKYYTCLCDGYQTTLRCYSLCPDDPQLQLQFRTQKESLSSSCKAASDMKLKESVSFSSSTSVSVSSKTLSASDSTSSSVSGGLVKSSGSISNTIGQTLTSTQILGEGGSKAMTPSSISIGDFTFFSGSVGNHICAFLAVIIAIVAF